MVQYQKEMNNWKEVVGYEGKYQVSTEGDVWSYSTSKYLEPLQVKGVWCCRLYDGKRQRHVPIHEIVAKVFVENPEGLPKVCHIDGNIHNNNMTNLKWTA